MYIRILAAVAIITFVALGMTGCSQHPDLADVQAGKAQLVCAFQQGPKVIPAAKVAGYDSNRSRWLFTNGSAHSMNCEVYRYGK